MSPCPFPATITTGTSIQLFLFLFLFSSCCSVDTYAVYAVSGHCNIFIWSFLCNPWVLMLMHPHYLQYYQCCSSFLTHIICVCYLLDEKPYSSSLVFLSSCSFVEVLPFQELSQVSYKESSLGAYPFNEISAAELGFKKFFVHPRCSFFIFFSSLFVW